MEVLGSFCIHRSHRLPPTSTTDGVAGKSRSKQPPSTGPGEHHRTQALKRAAEISRNERDTNQRRTSAGDAPHADPGLDLAILPETGRKRSQIDIPDCHSPESFPASLLASRR